VRLYVVITAGGQEWLTRASSAAAVARKWDAGEIIKIVPLKGDRARAAYLREIGQADRYV
jgi:hypothetical protein